MNKTVYSGLALALIGALLLLCPSDNRGGGSEVVDPIDEQTEPVDPKPEPEPEPDLLADVYDVMEKLHRELLRKSADKAAAGEFANSHEAGEFETEAFEIVKQTAFEPLKKYDDENMGGEKWSPEVHEDARRRLVK